MERHGERLLLDRAAGAVRGDDLHEQASDSRRASNSQPCGGDRK